MADTGPAAVFRFESPGLTVEFEGPEEWVDAQIEHFSARMRRAMAAATGTAVAGSPRHTGAAPEPAPAPDAATAATEAPTPTPATVSEGGPQGAPTLAAFYAAARSREGRGALQEQVLIFAFYLQTYGGRDHVSIAEIADCFRRVDATPPRNLANTLGIMKRSQGFLAAGAGRGRYRLTDTGLAYVRRLVGAH